MRIMVLIYLMLLLTACEQPSPDNSLNSSPKIDSSSHTLKNESVNENIDLTDYQAIEWIDLIPASDLDALMNPPDYIMQIEDGSFEDQIANSIQNELDATSSSPNNYQQALISTTIIEAMDKQKVTIPGFVVPVEFNDEHVIKSFFLVPFFGACLHMPPPPPNQIIYVESENGFPLESIYEPVMVSGQLSTELFEDQIATSAYTMQMVNLTLFDETE